MKLPSLEYFVVTRGVELADDDGSKFSDLLSLTIQDHKPSACHLHRLTLPQNGRGKARFETVKTYSHKE